MTEHDEALRETRRRWRELHDAPDVHAELDIRLGGVSDDLYDYWQATHDLAKAYYEQFSSDDESLADADWLAALEESLGDNTDVLIWLVRSGDGEKWWQLEKISMHGWRIIAQLTPDMTRGQVRRLLTALGIEVRQ